MNEEQRKAWGAKMKSLRFGNKNSANLPSEEPTLANPLGKDLDANLDEVSLQKSIEENIPVDGPSRAIRKFCTECVGSIYEIKTCCAYSCHLWDHRFGIRPDAAVRHYPEHMDREKVREMNSGRGR